MAKAKRKKPTSLVLQHELQPELIVVDRNVTKGAKPNDYTERNLKEWAAAAVGSDVNLKLKEKIVLSAASTVVKNKAWLNAISCRNVFPENPSIWFHNDRSDHFGGKMEFWLENLSGPKKLQFVIRMTGYCNGATITVGASCPTAYSLLPVTVNGSMNLTLGNILNVPSSTPGGLGLITMQVEFHNANYGAWEFVDVTITEVT